MKRNNNYLRKNNTNYVQPLVHLHGDEVPWLLEYLHQLVGGFHGNQNEQVSQSKRKV